MSDSMSKDELLLFVADLNDAGLPNHADQLLDMFERSRVVGVLDAWAAENAGRLENARRWDVTVYSTGHSMCYLMSGRDTVHSSGAGDTPDAARAAAAKAIEAGEV